MEGLIMAITPLGIKVAELAILVEPFIITFADPDIPVPLGHDGHVLTLAHLRCDPPEVRKLDTLISSRLIRRDAENALRDSVVGYPVRQRIANFPAFPERLQEIVDPRLADAQLLRYLSPGHV
jgi:hypothetical protein